MARKSVNKKRAATNGKVTKAQAIRDSRKELGRKARPRDIIAALAAQGVEVSSAQVSTTLKAAGARRKRRGRRGRPPGRRAVAGRGHGRNVSANDLLAAKELADRLGGVTAVKEALEVLIQLQ